MAQVLSPLNQRKAVQLQKSIVIAIDSPKQLLRLFLAFNLENPSHLK